MNKLNKVYDRHYERMNRITSESFQQADYREIESFLPQDKQTPILDVGCGQGHFLYYLYRLGYTNLSGVDRSCGQIEAAKKHMPAEINLSTQDGVEFLRASNQKYGFISLFDVIEHVKKDELNNFLGVIYTALSEHGKLIVRTPNMASLLGTYSRYLDMTHEVGFAEFSLMQVLEEAGFRRNMLVDQTKFYRGKRKYLLHLRNIICKSLFLLDGRTLPTVYDKNILMCSEKTD